MRIYVKYSECSGRLMQKAKIYFNEVHHQYGFETSLFGKEPYEANINMPLFTTEEKAHEWIIGTGRWSLEAQANS